MTTDLHPDQRRALRLLPRDCGVLLVTRHSLREEASNDMPGFDIPLTPEGVTLARTWGAELAPALDRAYASQSPRCIDTGEAMLSGAGGDADVEVVELLREPGCYVEDIRQAGPVFRRDGPLEFVNGILFGQVPGAYPARKATLRMLDWLASIAPPAGNMAVCVTHDTILGAFVHDLIERIPLAAEDWPWMMEGIFLWQDGDTWHWIWRGRKGEATREELAASDRSS